MMLNAFKDTGSGEGGYSVMLQNNMEIEFDAS